MTRLLLLEDQALLLCTRQDFTNDHVQALRLLDPKALNWDRVLRTALQNRIAPLVHTNLVKAGVELPPDVAVSFKKEYIENILRKKEARNLLNQVLICISEWQAEYQIPLRLMLVKGAALNVLIYAEPWYTRSGDIDLIFDLPASSVPEPALRQLINRIYAITSSSSSSLHSALEYDFYIHHDLNLNGVLPIDADRIWRNAGSIQLGGHCLLVMSPEDTLVSAAVACCRRHYFFLKSLLDLAECTRHLKNLNWDRVIEIAHSDSVNLVLYTGLWLSRECLDAQIPTWVFPELKISSFQEAMIQRFVSYMLAHFSFAYLTKVYDEYKHTLTVAHLLTYLTLQPVHSIRKITRSLESVLHG
jgi:hypothetical protein